MTRGVGGPSSGVPGGLDPKALEELEKLKEQLAKVAIQSMSGGTGATAPDLRGLAAPGDRDGAMKARLGANSLPMAQVEAAAVGVVKALGDDVNDPEMKALKDKLIDMGFLEGPADKVTQQQFEKAVHGAITKGMDDFGQSGELPGDMEELMALIDSLLQKDAHRRNGQGSGFQRPNRTDGGGGARSPYSPRSTGGAPATQPMVPVNPNAPAPGQINQAIANAARAYMGTSTRGGPDGGNLACAWAVNNILRGAGVQQLGSNPNAVASAREALEGGRGERIDPSQAQPGDIVIWPPPRSHIGIAMGNGSVVHNSSSRAAFVNNDRIPAGASVYRVTN